MFGKFWSKLGAAFAILSLATLAVAMATNHWFEIVNTKASQMNNHNRKGEDTGSATLVSASQDTLAFYPFPCHLGLWLTCYTENIPDTVSQDHLIFGSCTLDYDFPTYQIEDFSRTSVVSCTLSGGIILIACILCIVGTSCQKTGVVFHSGILLFVASLCSLIGLCAFTGRIILEQNEIRGLMTPNVCSQFQWSYFIAWSSLGLQLIAGSILVASSRAQTTKEELP